MGRTTLRGARALAVLGASLAATPALAAGYDTPILYSAQHMGMGGAAIAYVDDPTAMFHNPAGLARTMGLTLTVNATLILGSIQSTPDVTSGLTHESEPIMALAPLIGVSARPVDWFAFGVAFYPVASAGAKYRYDNAAGDGVENDTSVVFLEVTPSVAFKLPGNVMLGAGWRIIMASLDRTLTNSLFNFDAALSGTNLGGFRVGAQWDPIPELQIGVVYRNKTTTTLVDESGDALTPIFPEGRRIETDFTLPSKLGFGARLKLDPVRVALDVEYAFQSENEGSQFLFGEEKEPGNFPDPEDGLVNVFRWEDGITLRAGVEYALEDRYFFRGGFIYDTQVSNEKYPSAFGTPPTSTMTLTAGFGYKCNDAWKLNFGFSHRFGSTDVERGITPEDETCLPCSGDGPYELTMTGLYLDFTYSFSNIFD
ncbi:MAG: outer membrane protein transport protein [Deltaproteobacteria bacterium]|nr:outer membrane protein transport protein [Deltaproteobacteria bacterium]